MKFEDQVQGIEDEAELQEMMDAMATTALDTTIDHNLRELATKRRVLVQQRLSELTNPFISEAPNDVLERLRQTNPDAATALEHQMKVDSVAQTASQVAAAVLDDSLPNWQKPTPEKLEAAAKAADEARNTPPPFFQAQIDRKAAQDKAAGIRAAGTAMQGSGEAGIQAQAEQMLQEADSIEAAIQH